MPDFKIGSFKVAAGSTEALGNVIFYATLPFGGDMARAGRDGLFEIIAAIEKQYADHHAAQALAWLGEWMQKLAYASRVFEQARIDIQNDALSKAAIYSAMDEEAKRLIRDEQDLEFFLLDREVLKRPTVNVNENGGGKIAKVSESGHAPGR